MNPKSKSWVFLFFFVSGATGLVYEVVWTRLLTLVMGNTHYSIATVLTVFMAGLAAGSYFGGRFIDRTGAPLAVYAVLEAAIGVYCLLIPYLIDWAFPVFQWIYNDSQNLPGKAAFFRFLVCSGILILPTTLMGATLPVLSKYVSEDAEMIGRDVGTLYSMNTFGAVFGALGSAFLFMRLLGVSATINLAAAMNVGIALIIFAVFKPALGTGRLPAKPKAKPTEAQSFNRRTVLILLCFGLSGLCALVYQVAWNRIFSLLLGSSVYAFSLILTTFILGLALGTVSFSRRIAVFQDFIKVFGLLQVGIGLSALAGLPFFDKIPFVNRWVYENWSLEFFPIQWSNFLIIFSLLILPTFFMGAQFPIVIKLIAQDLETLGHKVGEVYASNTVGTIFGSFIGGFLLVPHLGIQNAILSVAFINLLLGMGLLFSSPSLKPSVKAYGLPGILIVGLWGAWSLGTWDQAVISSGSYIPYRIKDLGEAEVKANKILYYKEGIHTTVTTELAVDGNIFLRVNGKSDASLALDMRTQLLSGYLPMFFHDNPKTGLVIGQGSGITLGAVERFPLEEIDLVEISPAVIEGSRYFSPFNHQALDDPRVNIFLEDGRNRIALTSKKYDVIVSEPSNPWISGVGALFTIDFFEMLKKRLNPGGLVCIWVHTNMSPKSFKSITRSFSSAFSHVTMWESIVGDDYLLIGSMEEFGLPFERVEKFLADPVRGKDLRRIGVGNVQDLMSLMIMRREALIKFSGEAPIHTDDNSLLEFNAPKYIYRDDRDVLVRQLTPFIHIDPQFVKFESLSSEERLAARARISDLSRSESQVAQIKLRASIDQLLDKALRAFNSGDLSGALEHYVRILEQDPEHVMTYMNLGNVFKLLKMNDKSEAAYKKSLEINPYYVFGSLALANLYLSEGKPDQAVEVLEKTLEWYRGDPEIWVQLGLAYALRKTEGSAKLEWGKALKADPDFPLAHYYLGVHYHKKNSALSRKHLVRFLELARAGKGNESLIAKAESLLR